MKPRTNPEKPAALITGAVAALMLAFGLALSGCGNSSPGGAGNPALPPLPPPDGQGLPGPAPGEQRAGKSYDVFLTSFDGQTIAFTVHEPSQMVGGKTYPLLLWSHGFGLQRANASMRDLPGSELPGINVSFVGLPKAWLDRGYGELSIDERGHGQSNGKIHAMDPEVEGRELLQILDWAEANLNWLAYRDGNLVLGSMGVSYGGGYQHLINDIDPRRRLDAMIPQITWYDLGYSLAPGNVTKSGYDLALFAVSNTGLDGLDPELRDGLVAGIANTAISESLFDTLLYHSNRYFCEGVDQPGRAYRATPPPRVDVLYLQGMADPLFNLNEAVANYNCMSRSGGDVRLWAYHFSGHPPTEAGTLIPPPDAPASLFSCGSLDEFKLSTIWMDAKLKRDPAAIAFVKAMPKHCLSMDATGSGVVLDKITVGGTATPAFDTLVTQGVLALPTAVPITLYTATEQGEVLAGIPTATITIEPSPASGNPQGDPIIFVALVHGRAGLPGNLDIIDGQIRPLRGFGAHQLELNGITERLNAGDQVQLLITGSAVPQFAGIFSRDASNPVVKVSGKIDLPLLGVLPEAP